MAKLFGAQRLILQAVHDLPKNSAGFVSDSLIAQVTHISLIDVRNWIETLEGEDLIEVARTTSGLGVALTAKGRLRLGLYLTNSGSQAGMVSPEDTATLRLDPPAESIIPSVGVCTPIPSLPVASDPTSQPTKPQTAESGTGVAAGFQVVLLIHGIRTQAEWQSMVREKIAVPGKIEVIPIGYGYFDVIRFWFPFWTRSGPIERVHDEIRAALQKYRKINPDAKLSIIAHSFGTYVVGKILQRHFDLQIHRLVLCGSVLPQGFPWNQLQGRFDDDKVVNECGKADIWPVLAQSVSWGYGASGTHGFKKVLVKDRFHAGGHGQYFDPEFVEKYWEPFIRRGEYEGSEFEKSMPPTPWWISVLGILPLKWLITAIAIFSMTFLSWHAPGWFGVRQNDGQAEHRSTDGEDGRKLPPKPVAPGDIDIASASFMDYEGDARAPRLDLKLTNMGSRPAFITGAKVNVKKIWRLKELPQPPGVVVPPGHNYEIRLKPENPPYQVLKDISEGLKKDEFGRFSLQFVEDPWPSSNTIYLADVELIANSDGDVYSTKDFLFLITMHGVIFPDERTLGEWLRGMKSLGRNVDERLVEGIMRENKQMILEVDKIDAVRSPGLSKLIESAKVSTLGNP